jgi:hypothetical protein
LLVQVAPSGVASRELLAFHEHLKQTGATGDFLAVSEDPFWSLVGLVECPSLIARTCEWISGVK